jgi:hypothetical protein
MTLRALLLCFFCGALAGCVNLKPQQDSVKLYVLGPNEFTQPAKTSAASIYIARPNLPAYLDGKRLQYRHADGEVRSLHTARWAEPLQEGIARTLAEFLIESSDRRVSGFYPWPKQSMGDMELRVHFHKLGAMADGEIQMVAKWELLGSKAIERSGTYRSQDIQWRLGDAESLVAGFNQAIRQLALEVTGAL